LRHPAGQSYSDGIPVVISRTAFGDESGGQGAAPSRQAAPGRGLVLSEILYRKWRPRSFDEVAGQEHVATTLKNALATGRVAHAYLFAGPRGTGKTTTGRLMAKALNCPNRSDGEPCNQCDSCQAYLDGRAMDLIELDAASNRGIDEIRSLREKVAYHPSSGERKVYLIDEVHMLTEAAFNALLKTLEEPPPHVVFILATTEAHKLPATILSRCQRFDFRRAPLAAMVRNLQRICEGEGFTCEPAALELIARSATGSHRDAVNLLDQLATSYGSNLTLEHVRTGLGLIGDERSGQLARMALAGDLAGGLTLIASVRDDGLDLRQFQRELVDELRALLLVKNGVEPAEGATDERLQELREAVKDVATQQLLTALKSFGEADLKADPNSTLPLDIALAECAMQAARPADVQSVSRGAQTVSRPSGQPAAQSFTRPSASTTPRPPAEPPRRAPSAPVVRPEQEEVAPLVRLETVAPVEDREPPRSAFISPTPAEATLDAARSRMRVVYDRARAAGFQLGALLNSGCDIIEVDESAIVIGFRHPIHAQKASEKGNLDALAAIVSEVMGRPFSVRCVHEPSVEPWSTRSTSSRSALVRAAQEMGARVISPADDFSIREPED
jgi:DNA polymerase-3 subunit gamma/tau